jgi:putative transposase
MLTLIDEYSRQCLAIKVATRQKAIDVINTLAAAMLLHGIPQHIRSDNGPKMTAKLVQDW